MSTEESIAGDKLPRKTKEVIPRTPLTVPGNLAYSCNRFRFTVVGNSGFE